MARPSKLTPELQAEMEKLFATGCTIETACAMVGLGISTFHNWMVLGKEGGSGNGKYMEFWDVIKKAQAVPLTESIAIVRKAARPLFDEVIKPDGTVERSLVNGGSWQAAAWILERKDPKHYAKRTYHKIEGLDDFVKWCEKNTRTPGDLFQQMIQAIEEEERELASVDASGTDSD